MLSAADFWCICLVICMSHNWRDLFNILLYRGIVVFCWNICFIVSIEPVCIDLCFVLVHSDGWGPSTLCFKFWFSLQCYHTCYTWGTFKNCYCLLCCDWPRYFHLMVHVSISLPACNPLFDQMTLCPSRHFLVPLNKWCGWTQTLTYYKDWPFTISFFWSSAYLLCGGCSPTFPLPLYLLDIPTIGGFFHRMTICLTCLWFH